MAHLQWIITGNTTARDLLATGTAATAVPANETAIDATNRTDSTKTTGTIQSFLICNNYTATSTVDLYTERWDGSSAGTKMYILKSVALPVGTTLIIDTPILFNRATDKIFAKVSNASESVTLYMDYELNKKIS